MVPPHVYCSSERGSARGFETEVSQTTESNLIRTAISTAVTCGLEGKQQPGSPGEVLVCIHAGQRACLPQACTSDAYLKTETRRVCTCAVVCVFVLVHECVGSEPGPWVLRAATLFSFHCLESGWQETIVSGWLVKLLWPSAAGRIIAFLGARYTNDSLDRVFFHFTTSRVTDPVSQLSNDKFSFPPVVKYFRLKCTQRLLKWI